MQTCIQITYIAIVRTLRIIQKLVWGVRIGWDGNVLAPCTLEDLRPEPKHLCEVWLERQEDLNLNTQHLCKIKKKTGVFIH